MQRAGDCTAAYERGCTYWAQAAARPRVARALAFFLREPATRSCSRLDLVSWVQWVCGFGGVGPTRHAWHELFRACCCDGDGAANGDVGNVPERFAVHEVAVLLAFWGCCGDDAAASMTNHNLVKGRVRPAVEGRSCQARTPGILSAVESAFADFVYAFIGRGLLEAAKRDVDVDMLDGDCRTRGTAATSNLRSVPSDDWRNVIMAEVQRLTTRHVRDWELVVRSWLRLRLQPFEAPSAPIAAPDLAHEVLARAAETARVFLCARADARSQLHDAFFRKLSVRLWCNKPTSYIGVNAPLRPLTTRDAGRPSRSGRTRTSMGLSPMYSRARLSFDASVCDSDVGGGGGSVGGGGGTESLRSLWSASTTAGESAIESTPGVSGASGSSNTPSPAQPMSPESLASLPTGGLSMRRVQDRSSSAAEIDPVRSFDYLWPAMRHAYGVEWRMEILDALSDTSEVNVAEARFTVLELHAPGGMLGEASLEFLPSDVCDIVPRSGMHPACPTGVASASYERTACLRLAGADCCLDSVEICGARPSSRCRALQVIVGVVEVPPAFGDDDDADAEGSALCGLGGRHRFRHIRAEWVDLDGSPGKEDVCEELDPETEINNEDQDPILDNEARCASVASGGGTARYMMNHMMNGAAMVCSIVDVADDLFQFPVRFSAPRRRQVLPSNLRAAEPFKRRRTRDYYAVECMEEGTTGNYADVMDVVDDCKSASISDVRCEEMEDVHGIVQLDCSFGARMFFNRSEGTETGLKQTSPKRNIFRSSPAWKTRAP